MITGGRATLVRMGLLAVLWGSSFLWIKLALTGLSPLQIAVTRCALGAAVVVVLCYTSRNRLPRDKAVWGHLVFAAFFGNALPFVLFAVGEKTVDTGVAGVLNATTPLWALLLGIIIGTDRDLRLIRVLGLLLGFGGTLLIFAPWEKAGVAGWDALAILAAAISYAVSYAYIGRKLSGRGTAPIALSAAQLLTATGLTAIAVPVGGLQPVHLNLTAIIAVTILGVFGTGFAFALNYRLIADEGATQATTVGYLLPVVSVLLGAVALGEDLTFRIIAGMVVVLIGVGMTRWQRKPAAVPVEAEVALPAKV
ncbi:DMT family transporter [Actinokineospora sp. HUAS TT18]|uniref:DMT family transporter n=1 Tax=Actinokineospora sp. HUAS TT18 TaxID=3447451 RepID=UPI003F523D62